MAVNAVANAVFLAVMSACLAVSVAIFKSFSFGAYVGSDCRTEIKPAKCCMSWSYDWCDELMVVGAGVFGSTVYQL
jgi:hypothetical protein